VATNLSAVSPTLLPPTIVGPIFAKAVESSAVMSLARRVPLSVTAQTAIPVPLDVPLADWVVEGGRKPVSSGAVNVKTMAGKKVAVLIPVSEEVAMSNPASLYDQLTQDLPTAISRAFDYAAIHGRAINGGPGPFGDYLAETSNSVTLGTTAQGSGGLYTDIVNGEALVEANSYDFTGFAADPRIRSQLKTATTTQGLPLFVPNLVNGGGIGDGATGNGSLDGFPIAYNRGVGGKLWRQSNVNTRSVTVSTTSASTAVVVTTGAFDAGDVGKTITGAGIPAGATISAVTDATHITISAAATATATGVAGTVQGAADTLLRAVGGDWGQCAYGVGMDISVRISREASYVDTDGTTHSAFQENLVLLLAEAYYGFVVGNTNAFVRYMHS
jgi:hypothetical protein